MASSSSVFADLLPGAPLDLLAEGGGNLSRWFWNDEVWLPPNVTWEDLRWEFPATFKKKARFPGTFEKKARFPRTFE